MWRAGPVPLRTGVALFHGPDRAVPQQLHLVVFPRRVRRVLPARRRGAAAAGGHRAPTPPGTSLGAAAGELQPQLARLPRIRPTTGRRVETGPDSCPVSRSLPRGPPYGTITGIGCR